jgi:hypothetical protein
MAGGRARTWPRFARIWPGAASPGASTEPAQRYGIRFRPAARRAIGQRTPEAVAAAALEFCYVTKEQALELDPNAARADQERAYARPAGEPWYDAAVRALAEEGDERWDERETWISHFGPAWAGPDRLGQLSPGARGGVSLISRSLPAGSPIAPGA